MAKKVAKKFLYSFTIVLALAFACSAWTSDAEQLFKEGMALYQANYSSEKFLEPFLKAAEQGHAGAQYWLGSIYEYGERGVSKDSGKAAYWYTKALEHSSRAAEQGDADGQYWLGGIYQYGRGGVSKDSRKALQLFRKAAEQGHEYAQYTLARMYHNGNGVKTNYKQAFQWYSKAAEHAEDGTAYYMMGFMHEKGQGVPRDEAKAIEYWVTAAQKGSGSAEVELKKRGVNWHNATRVAQTPAQQQTSAAKTPETAAASAQGGEAASAEELLAKGKAAHNAGNYKEAFSYCEKALKADNDDNASNAKGKAAYNLGSMYYYGQGVATNYRAARTYMSMASNMGFPIACHAAAYMYYTGQGGDKDVAYAKHLWTRGASLGNWESQQALAALEGQAEDRRARNNILKRIGIAVLGGALNR